MFLFRFHFVFLFVKSYAEWEVFPFSYLHVFCFQSEGGGEEYKVKVTDLRGLSLLEGGGGGWPRHIPLLWKLRIKSKYVFRAVFHFSYIKTEFRGIKLIKSRIKNFFRYICASLFLGVKERTCETRKDVFLFLFKSSYCSWENQVLEF